MKQYMLTNEEIGSLCMALAHLLHAGIATGDALDLLRQEEKEPAFRKLLETLAADADEGKPLAGSFAGTGCFPAYVCTLLEVGERVGKLEETLTALARYYRSRVRLEQRLRATLLYPAVLLLVLLAVVAVLLIWVLPVFDDVYAQLGSRLTGIAGGLLALGGILRRVLPAAGILTAAALVIWAIPGVRGRIKTWVTDRFGHRGVLGKANEARFIQALSMAVSSGMTAQEGVSLASNLSQGKAFRSRCGKCLELLDSGESLAQALRGAGLLPSAECRLLEAGVKGGNGETVLEDISQRMLESSEDALERAAGKVEPALVAAACVMIGLVLLSVMLPLMDIMTAIG